MTHNGAVPLVLTPDQVAEILQVSVDVVRALKEQGRLPFVQLTRQRWRVPAMALDQWLREEARASAPSAAPDPESAVSHLARRVDTLEATIREVSQILDRGKR